ncbi:ATP-binding protein [Streptomyces sp. NPDC002476]|uniref:ATP-binding protein n=1 Tax=Streptomyces sp. NPDC002476 TaxID=3364648 RepID=UPI0036C2AA20
MQIEEFAMRTYPLTRLCPVAAESGMPGPSPYPPPFPQSGGRSDARQSPGPYLHSQGRSRRALAMGFTLPGDVRSAFISRTAVGAGLAGHGLGPYVWPTVHVVSELVAVAVRMSPDKEVYVSVRHRDDALRIVVWDQHPRHADPDMAALCEARRRRALWLMEAVVDDWGGERGACDAPSPHRGTKSWVVLPR